jgi:hypothetical protein
VAAFLSVDDVLTQLLRTGTANVYRRRFTSAGSRLFAISVIFDISK